MRKTRGFTLIELLIVVAIIAILAAIAVPNFLEAQVRSKVSRSLADMRSITTALEAYCVDYQKYPPYSGPDNPSGDNRWRLNHLTTPVAYITSIPMDPFANKEADSFTWRWHLGSYVYAGLADWGLWNRTYAEAYRRGSVWFLSGLGPNRFHDALDNVPNNETTYDATNGTRSRGDLERFGP